MNRLLSIVCTCILIIGCASNKYGYSSDEWSSLTQPQRDEIKAAAEENIKKMTEEDREEKFENRPLNTIFGTRSNVY